MNHEYSLFLDTNALLNLQENAFKEKFYISQKTLEELESIKTSSHKDADIKFKARNISRLLNKHEGEYVVVTTQHIEETLSNYHLSETPDNIIIASAKRLETLSHPLLFCTDDLNCKFIAQHIFGLKTKSAYELDLISEMENYSGYKELILNSEQMSDFYLSLPNNVNNYGLLENEYLIIKTLEGKVVDIYKWSQGSYMKVCSKTINSKMFGDKIRPKDELQACAIDSILSNTLTAISGKAGSGKSLIALSTIMNLIESGKYDRLVVMFNPTKAKGASDMGFYSGDSIEKAMQNSIGSILTTKFGDRYAVDILLQQDKIKLISMADIRGMEVRDEEILWITECQNTSVELLKLCLSRVSSGSKVIIEGDYTSQVDSYAFEHGNNGMKRAIDVLKGEPEFGYIQLQNVWRSRIAELVEKM